MYILLFRFSSTVLTQNCNRTMHGIPQMFPYSAEVILYLPHPCVTEIFYHIEYRYHFGFVGPTNLVPLIRICRTPATLEFYYSIPIQILCHCQDFWFQPALVTISHKFIYCKSIFQIVSRCAHCSLHICSDFISPFQESTAYSVTQDSIQFLYL